MKPHINFFCSQTCLAEDLSDGRSPFKSSYWKDGLAGTHVSWHVAGWLAGWLTGRLAHWWTLQLVKDMSRPTPQFALPLSTFSFCLVAKVTPGLEEKHPTYCLHSREREKNWEREQKQTSRSLLWFRYSKWYVVLFIPIPALQWFLFSTFQFYKTCSHKLTKFIPLTAHL